MSATMTVKFIIKNIAKFASNMFRGKRRKEKVMRRIETFKEKIKNAIVEVFEDVKSEAEEVGMTLMLMKAIEEAITEGLGAVEEKTKERIAHEQERNAPGE